MIKIKKDVRIDGIRPEMLFGLQVLAGIWPGDMVVTSVTDGPHSAMSLHNCGRAVDLRIRDFSPAVVRQIAANAREVLGHHFDVVVEPTHLHVEYDPKK